MKKTTRLIGCFLLAAIVFSNCKKERPPVKNSPAQRNLEIRLNTAYLPVTKIDSAVLLWEVAGQVQRHTFARTGDTLRLPLSAFNEGQGRMTIQLYSRVQTQWKDVQFEKRWELSVSHHQPIHLKGPINLNDPEWMPRVILKGSSPFVAIVALRPGDPYFSLRNLPARWPMIEVERGYYEVPGGVRYAGKKLWKCNGTCGTDFEDRNIFAGLGGDVGTKPWTWIEIGIGLFSNTDYSGLAYSYTGPR